MAIHTSNENRRQPTSMLFTVVLVLGIPLIFGCCPVGWLQHSRSCYALNQEETTWYEAQEICRANGGHLAWIDSAEENAFINTILNPSRKNVWIGLHDHAKELNFVWVDTPQLPIYTNFYNGEPNSYSGRDEDCVEIWYNGQWNDEMCTSLRSSVCEKPNRRI